MPSLLPEVGPSTPGDCRPRTQANVPGPQPVSQVSMASPALKTPGQSVGSDPHGDLSFWEGQDGRHREAPAHCHHQCGTRRGCLAKPGRCVSPAALSGREDGPVTQPPGWHCQEGDPVGQSPVRGHGRSVRGKPGHHPLPQASPLKSFVLEGNTPAGRPAATTPRPRH